MNHKMNVEITAVDFPSKEEDLGELAASDGRTPVHLFTVQKNLVKEALLKLGNKAFARKTRMWKNNDRHSGQMSQKFKIFGSKFMVEEELRALQQAALKNIGS